MQFRNQANEDRHWALVRTINRQAYGEGWCINVMGDGMMVIELDDDASKPKHDGYDYVERRAAEGSTLHIIALGCHGLILTDEQYED